MGWRSTVGLLFLSYLLLVANRKSFQYVIPYVSAESWVRTTDIGLIISSQTLGYTVSKFLGGLAADRVNNRLALCTALFLSSIVTQIFTLSRNVLLSAILWFVSGTIQGVTWPAIAKILRHTVPASQFGLCWVVVSCSMNLASVAMPPLSAYLSQRHHWTTSLSAISGTTFVFSFLVMLLLLQDCWEEARALRGRSRDEVSVSWRAILSDPVLLSLSMGYYCISMLRYTATDWMPLFLVREVGMSQIFASSFLSLLETGGIVGSLLAAKISDLCVQRWVGRENARVPCIIVFTMIAANATFVMAILRPGSSVLLVSVLAIVLGVAIYGPVSMYGVAAIESAPDQVSGACNAFVALMANLGATAAGYPISALSNLLGWRYTFQLLVMLLSCSGLGLYLCRNSVPLRKKRE